MKKLLFITLALLLSVNCYAKKEYFFVSFYNNTLSGYSIELRVFDEGSDKLSPVVSEDGEIKYFKNPNDVFNFLAECGWEYKEDVPGIKLYLFERDVTDDMLTKKILTLAEYKKAKKNKKDNQK